MIRIAHVMCRIPAEAFVEVDVRRRPIAHRQRYTNKWEKCCNLVLLLFFFQLKLSLSSAYRDNGHTQCVTRVHADARSYR